MKKGQLPSVGYKRCWIYTRFSPRRNEDQCTSCEVQEDHCRVYAKNRGIVVGPTVYHDRAFSGDDVERPALWQMIEKLHINDIVLVYRLDRLARDVFLSHVIENAVTAKGATIQSAMGEGTWGDSPSDRLTRQILQALAEYERKVISARTSIAMRRHQENGRIMSYIPKYGWRKVDEKKVERDMYEQDQITRILDLRTKGELSFSLIAKQLNSEGLLRRGKPWIATSVFHIWKNHKDELPEVPDPLAHVDATVLE